MIKSVQNGVYIVDEWPPSYLKVTGSNTLTAVNIPNDWYPPIVFVNVGSFVIPVPLKAKGVADTC